MDAVPCDTSCPGAVGKNRNPSTCGLGNLDASESEITVSTMSHAARQSAGIR